MKILEIVYMFINQIKSEGAQEYIFEEFQCKSVIDFKNLTNPSPLGTASSLSRKMNFMKDKDMPFIHKKPFIYETLDK